MKSEIKENVQGTNSEGKEIGTQINGLEQKEETKIQNNEDRLRNLWDNFKSSNIQIIGVPEEKRKSKKLKTCLKKLMKENFPNLVREIDMQVQEAQTVPNRLDPKRATPRHCN